ncbi:MAG: transposase [Microcystis panniformis WG22]|nr:transposase [Microcystis panniformis WG22]
MAVATLWMVMLGGEAENQSPEPNLEQLPPEHTVFSKTLHLKPLRQISCFLLGSITLVADLLKGLSIHPHRWSSFPPTPVDAFYYSPSSLVVKYLHLSVPIDHLLNPEKIAKQC